MSDTYYTVEVLIEDEWYDWTWKRYDDVLEASRLYETLKAAQDFEGSTCKGVRMVSHLEQTVMEHKYE